ncbi:MULTISPECIES: DsbA family protein [Hyphomonas]|uniref:DsbA family protein n=1 Tax=Hyphomonas TaxID=85 RepID=UPI0002F34DBE|nr:MULTISPECIES: DsbA family protein [Hyphomonas]
MTVRAPIEFWFDFSSGYAYLAACEIDALSARVGRDVLWRPSMLGAAFKVTGMRGLSAIPMKAEYARHDWSRAARRIGVDMILPDGRAGRDAGVLLGGALLPRPFGRLCPVCVQHLLFRPSRYQ